MLSMRTFLFTHLKSLDKLLQHNKVLSLSEPHDPQFQRKANLPRDNSFKVGGPGKIYTESCGPWT